MTSYKITVYKTGVNFGFTGVIKVGRKVVYSLNVYPTRQGAEEAGKRWIAKQASLRITVA